MLQKWYIGVSDYTLLFEDKPVVLVVESGLELTRAFEILKTRKHGLRGLQLSSSLLDSVIAEVVDFKRTGGVVNYLSIVLEQGEDIGLILKLGKIELDKKLNLKLYLELIVPVKLFTADILKQCERVNRVIISVDSEEELLRIPDIFKEMVLWKRFPIVKNVPLCKIDVKHAFEIYIRDGLRGDLRVDLSRDKPKECAGCVLMKYCFYKEYKWERFIPAPILDTTTVVTRKYEGVLNFVNHEDFTARF